MGDPKQLAATVIATAVQRTNYGRSMFERIMALPSWWLKTSVFDACPPMPSREPLLLDVQYRMHPHISRWPNETFYGGRLKDDDSVQHHAAREGHLQLPTGGKWVAGGRGGAVRGSATYILNTHIDNMVFCFSVARLWPTCAIAAPTGVSVCLSAKASWPLVRSSGLRLKPTG